MASDNAKNPGRAAAESERVAASPRETRTQTEHGDSKGDVDRMEDARIDPKLDRLIGRSLEAHYADLVAAPLPDAIMVLLAQLEASEKAASGPSTSMSTKPQEGKSCE